MLDFKGTWLLSLCLLVGSPLASAQTCGDCNLDGVVDILDALAAARDAVRLQPLPLGGFYACDVDSGGTINALDAFRVALFTVGGPVTLACPPAIDLDADTNRDGLVTDDAADETGEDTWSSAGGAVFLANLDDDNADDRLDATTVGIDGALDAADLARLVLRAAPAAPVGATVELSVVTAAATTRVRVVRETSPGAWTTLLEPTAPGAQTIPASLLASADLTLGIEATAMRSPSWDGRTRLRARLLQGATELARDEVELRVSPIILPDNTRPGGRVHAVEITTPFQAPNVPYIDAFESELSAAGVPWLWANQGVVAYDRWEQDNMQCGYQSMPRVGGGGVHAPYAFILANRQGRGLYDYLAEVLVGPDFGLANPGASVDTSLNSHGNLDVLPPHIHGGNVFPLGRVLLGGGSAPPLLGGAPIVRHMDPVHRNFFDAQEIQGPHLEVSSEWLIVGHVDEFLTFIPDLSGATPWKMGLASPDVAIADLQDLASRGLGSRTVFAGRAGYQTTVAAILADSALLTFNAAAQTRLDSIRELIKSETGLDESRIIDLPVLFEPYPSGGVTYAVAYCPAVVNMQIVAPDLLLVPDPEGPDDLGVDVWQATTTALLQAAAGPFTIRYVDCFTSYHELLGEVHCGSNVDLAPYALPWWNP